MNGKLVRDKIPDLIRAEGQDPRFRVLEPRERLAALTTKLFEEAHEVCATPTLEEPADVPEVLQAITGELGSTWDQVLETAQDKRAKRGGFERGYVIEAFNTKP